MLEHFVQTASSKHKTNLSERKMGLFCRHAERRFFCSDKNIFWKIVRLKRNAFSVKKNASVLVIV